VGQNAEKPLPTLLRRGLSVGMWGQHSTSVTLAPDGSAHYAVWLGVANGTSWSATWSAMTSTTAMIVMATQLESHGDTSSQWLHRYSGEAFTFTLRPDGYATITDPSGKPITLCPRGTGFHDTQGLCGA
jgi:serine/threonine protein kinase, bacterial